MITLWSVKRWTGRIEEKTFERVTDRFAFEGKRRTALASEYETLCKTKAEAVTLKHGRLAAALDRAKENVVSAQRDLTEFEAANA